MQINLDGWQDLANKKLINENKAKLDAIKKKILNKSNNFSFLRNDNNEETFKLILEAELKFKSYEKILLIGTGGSSLGAKTFLSIIENDRVVFLENLDPVRVLKLLKSFQGKKLGLIIISKSGKTLEVLCLLDIIMNKLKDTINIERDAIIISDNIDSKLNQIANYHNIKFINHDPSIGGRYSCFSITGLLPLQLAGYDSIYLKKKADKEFIDNLATDKFNNLDAVNILASITKEKLFVGHVFLVYIESFSPLAAWYRQLWAESLGKNKLGLHMMSAIGAVDQHSQLQMWMDGPNNLVFTIVIPKKRKYDIRTSDTDSILPDYLKGKNIGEVLNTMGLATANELKKANKPVRIIYLEDDSIKSAISLMTTFLLEVSFIGEIIGVNPFNQPAVEKIKSTTKFMLNNYDRD